MLTINETEAYLKSMLEEDKLNFIECWNTFKRFCEIKVKEEEDLEVLIQSGEINSDGEALYYFGMVRQFTIYNGDEYSRMEQLHCNYYFEPSEVLENMDLDLWSMDYENLESFFDCIEGFQEFKNIMNIVPLKMEIVQEEV